MDNTVSTFWKMCREKEVINIVTLCKLHLEGTKPYCYNFVYNLPARTIESNKSWTFKRLVKDKDSYNHFHFLDWPDFGAPSDYQSLIDLG